MMGERKPTAKAEEADNKVPRRPDLRCKPLADPPKKDATLWACYSKCDEKRVAQMLLQLPSRGLLLSGAQNILPLSLHSCFPRVTPAPHPNPSPAALTVLASA